MNKQTVERIVTGFVAVILILTFFVVGRSGANVAIDDAQGTSAALQNTVDELLSVTHPPDLSDDLADMEAQRDALATEIAEILALPPLPDPTDPAPTPTPTLIPPTPTAQFCYPSNLDEVVAIRDPRVNLWEVIGENKAGKFIMDIYEDDDGNRVQYTVGVTFFIYEDAILTDGGLVFYEVFGPLGKGLYVLENHIKLFDADPDLYLCSG